MPGQTAEPLPRQTAAAGPPAGAGRRARPRRWWLLAAASLLAGASLGVGLADAVLPGVPAAGSNQLVTSTGGVFTREHGQVPYPVSLPGLRDPHSRLTLAQFRGHPVVLNFWASWCAPCRAEMPAMEAVARAEQGRVRFVGVDVNDRRGAALAFLRLTKVSYPVGYDPHAVLAAHYGVYGLPTTFFVSASGRLVGEQVGGLTRTRLAELLAEVFGPAPAGQPTPAG